MDEMEARRPGRPRGSAGVELLAIAREAFLAGGFAGTTMDAVAGTARISKNTLYREYASKDLLFAAVVTDWVDRGRDAMRPAMEALVTAQDTVAALHRLARTLQAAVLSPSVLQMRKLVAAEAGRFPEVASDYVARSWERNIHMLADAFAVLVERGDLVTDAPHVAAEQLTWLAVAAPLNRTTYGAGAHSSTELEGIAADAVTTVLARFGPS